MVQCPPVTPHEDHPSRLSSSTGAAAWLVFAAQLTDVVLPLGLDDVCDRDATLAQSYQPMPACAKNLFIEWHARRSTVCVRYKPTTATQPDAEVVEACAPDLIAAVHDTTICDTAAASQQACWYVVRLLLE